MNTSLAIGGTSYAPVTDNLKGLGTATPAGAGPDPDHEPWKLIGPAN